MIKSANRFFAEAANSCLDFLFPPLCFHCEDVIEKRHALLCNSCANLLQMIDPSSRCLYCYNELDTSAQICAGCLKKTTLFHRMAAVFDYAGPAAALVKKLKYGNQPYLAQGAGAFLAAQFLRMDWPLPDAIVPVPLSSIHRFERGYNQSELMARSMAAILGVPCINALGRQNGGYSQAALPHHQRIQLKDNVFFVKKGVDLHDRRVLLIDDVMTTGATLSGSAAALLEQSPSQLYGLAFCRSGGNDS